MAKKKTRRDTAEIARSVVEQAIGEKLSGGELPPKPVEDTDDGKDPAAVELSRKGASKGGKARAARLTTEKRSEIARNAANVRWSNVKKQSGKG